MTEETSKKGEIYKKNIVKAIVLGLIAVGAVVLLMPFLEKYNFQKSTEVKFPSSEELNINEEDMGKLQSDYTAAQEILKNDPYNLDANLKKAEVLSFLEEYDKALVTYEKMSEMYPDDSRPFRGMGDIYFTKRNYTQAKESYMKAISIDPKGADAYVQMARLYEYLDAGNEEKNKFYNDSIKKLEEEQRDRLINYYAKYLESVGEYDKAIEQLRIILAKSPNDSKLIENIERLDDLKPRLQEN